MESRSLGQGLKVEERRQLLHRGIKAALIGGCRLNDQQFGFDDRCGL